MTASALRILFVIVLVVASAACGGSGDDTAGGSSEPAGEPAGAGTVAVDIAGSAFSPAEVTAAVGQTVEWTNSDDFGHTVTFDDDAVPGSDTLDGGATFSTTFEEAGAYPYTCAIHPDMKGTVTVE